MHRMIMHVLSASAMVVLAIGASPVAAHPTSGHPHQHPEEGGHLLGTGEWGDVDFLGKAEVANQDDLVADVAVDPRKNYAYLANWGRPTCSANSEAGGTTNPDAGAWVIDIADPADPQVKTFIPHSQDSRPGEGMQALEITTKWFNGVMLVMNNEQCGKNGKGGVSLFDVTNPLKPTKVSEHFGDRNPGDVNEIHSAFAWDTGDRAYVVMTDNAEATDVDILDITNPKRPRLIADLNLNTLFGFRIDQPEIGVTESSLHDMIVKKIGSRWIMLLSYWDGGYVQMDVTNPANPTYISDTDFTNPDPELFESAGKVLPPEGNAHQAEYTADDRFFIATDEDFSPYRSTFTIDTGTNTGEYPAGEFGWTVPVTDLPDGRLNGPTVFGGYGCPDDRAAIPQATTAIPTVAPGEERIIVFERGPVQDPSHNHEACFFSEKIESGQLAGYDGVVVANHHVGAQAGSAPDAQFCGSQGHDFTVTAAGVCIGHRAMHLIFNDSPNYEVPYAGGEPAVGALGEKVSFTPDFDGWGYVHLYGRQSAAELDTFAVPEAHEEAYAFGFGALSVHEVATHPTAWDQSYLSYYAAGIRSLEIRCSDPSDESTCELVETGGYLDPHGNDFWGVETFVKDGRTFILGSDMDSGLWIFEDTNP